MYIQLIITESDFAITYFFNNIHKYIKIKLFVSPITLNYFIKPLINDSLFYEIKIFLSVYFLRHCGILCQIFLK